MCSKTVFVIANEKQFDQCARATNCYICNQVIGNTDYAYNDEHVWHIKCNKEEGETMSKQDTNDKTIPCSVCNASIKNDMFRIIMHDETVLCPNCYAQCVCVFCGELLTNCDVVSYTDSTIAHKKCHDERSNEGLKEIQYSQNGSYFSHFGEAQKQDLNSKMQELRDKILISQSVLLLQILKESKLIAEVKAAMEFSLNKLLLEFSTLAAQKYDNPDWGSTD